jgi:hypothetical protein
MEKEGKNEKYIAVCETIQIVEDNKEINKEDKILDEKKIEEVTKYILDQEEKILQGVFNRIMNMHKLKGVVFHRN